MLEEQRENFVAAVRKRKMLAVTKVKMSGSKKKKSELEFVRHFLHKPLTRKFLEVSLLAKQRQRKCAARAELIFC